MAAINIATSGRVGSSNLKFGGAVILDPRFDMPQEQAADYAGGRRGIAGAEP